MDTRIPPNPSKIQDRASNPVSSASPSSLRPSPVGRESAIGFAVEKPPSSRPWRWLLKILYALAASIFSVWLVSFTPVESPGPAAITLANAEALLYIPDGRAFAEAIAKHRVFAECQADADIKTVLRAEDRIEQLRKEYRKLPGIVRDLVPFSFDGLFPFIGQDFALSSAEGPNGRPMLLGVTRVSGFRGQLVRLGAWLSPEAGKAHLYALRGDLVAVGLNGATPIGATPLFRANSTPRPLVLVQLAPRIEVPTAQRDWRRLLPEAYRSEYDQILPDSVKEALARPPTVFEMLGQPRPTRVELALWLQPDGSFAAAGETIATSDVSIDRPPLRPSAAVPRVLAPDAPYAEALLPISVKHCFLALTAGALAGKSEATRLHKGQRRWTPRFARLSESGISLDDDLFPAFGNTLQLAVQDPPPEIDTAGYGLCGLRIPFKGTKTSREAFTAGMRAHYTETIEENGARANQIPYLRIQRAPERDRYVEATGQIHAPLWDVSNDRIDVVSDAGPLALMKPEMTHRPEVKFSEPFAATPAFWYARFNGPRIAPTVEKIATAEFDGMQEQLGAEQFLKEYPDSGAWIKLYGKLARALGDFALELRPMGAPGNLQMQLTWKPGTLKGGAEESDDAVPPPPIQ